MPSLDTHGTFAGSRIDARAAIREVDSILTDFRGGSQERYKLTHGACPCHLESCRSRERALGSARRNGWAPPPDTLGAANQILIHVWCPPWTRTTLSLLGLGSSFRSITGRPPPAGPVCGPPGVAWPAMTTPKGAWRPCRISYRCGSHYQEEESTADSPNFAGAVSSGGVHHLGLSMPPWRITESGKKQRNEATRQRLPVTSRFFICDHISPQDKSKQPLGSRQELGYP